MTKFYTMGCYTEKGLAGFVGNPSTNRKAATQALVESGGAKLTDYSLLRGAFDFIAVCEAHLNKWLQQRWLPYLVEL